MLDDAGSVLRSRTHYNLLPKQIRGSSYLVICIGAVTGVTGKWIGASFCPALSVTTRTRRIMGLPLHNKR